MIPVILFRKDRDTEEEFSICSEYLKTYSSRSQIPSGSLVIGRYSVLPFYKELEEDLVYNGSKLINSYRQHRYIADLSNWYQDFADITPTTWFRLEDVPKTIGSVVLKGETNSMKYNWTTHMFANNYKEMLAVYRNLEKDSLVGQQNICIREYIPLRTLRKDLAGGFPVTEEYRFFIFNKKVVASGFYWSSHYDLLEDKTLNLSPDNVPKEFIKEIIERVGSNTNAFVVDVAKTNIMYNGLYNKHPGWIVVELNDFSMSGLSECDPRLLYSNIKESFK